MAETEVAQRRRVKKEDRRVLMAEGMEQKEDDVQGRQGERGQRVVTLRGMARDRAILNDINIFG